MSVARQFSFSSGELDPSLRARADLVKYVTGLAACRNGRIKRQGGYENRGGTTYVTTTANAGALEARLIPFIFNVSTAYLLEFGENYIKVWRAGVLKATVVTTYTAAEVWELDYDQSADVMNIAHPSHKPAELTRTGDTSWAVADTVFAPSIAKPTGLGASVTAGAQTVKFYVAAVDAVTGEEGLASWANSTGTANPSAGAGKHTYSWSPVAGAGSYNTYLETDSGFGFYKTFSTGPLIAGSVTAVVDSTTVDVTRRPVTDRALFQSINTYPSVVARIQQRLLFAAANNYPKRVWGSRTGTFKNFTVAVPAADSDSLEFDVAGSQVNAVRHLLDLTRLVILPADGASRLKPLLISGAKEYRADGAGDGALTPSAIGLKAQADSALYVEARGSMVRDLTFDYQIDGYRGNELSLFAAHLVDGFEIVDWAFQKTPHYTAWMVRDDGVLLGLTYVREQQLIAWHRHDTDGEFESVCCIPEGAEDAVYVVVKRTINGTTVRNIERMASRSISDIRDAIFMDAAGTYDGRNTGSTTMTLSGGTTWTTEELTLTASTSTFVAADVDNAVFLTDADGAVFLRLTITEYVSATVVSVRSDRAVPLGSQGVATTSWSLAKKNLTGLSRLEGKSLSILGDGFVVASPNNPDYSAVTVSGGSITLSRPYAVIQYGLPYVSDLETLDLDTAQGETLATKKKCITRVSARVKDSRGIFAGVKSSSDDDTTSGMRELKQRTPSGTGDSAPPLLNEVVDIDINGVWDKTGKILLRQVDPLPMEILSVMPTGLIPGGA